MEMLIVSPTRPKASTRGHCDCRETPRINGRGTITTSPADSFSRKQKRHTRRVACGIFLVSLWFCMLDSDVFSFLGRAVSAEGPIVPSISSSSLFSSSSSSVSKSKARIVVPSSLCQDEEDIGDYDQIELPEESFKMELSSDPISNPVAFLSREASRRRKSSRNFSPPLFSTNSVCVHRSSNSDTDGAGGAEEERYEEELLPMDGASSRIPSPSRSSFKKTGTTIAGCVVPGGRSGRGPYVILAADTRATAGTIVADKRCDKIHKLASNCRCCGAGTSADLDKVTRQVLYQMALQELQNTSIGNGDVNFRDTKKGTGCSGSKELLYPEHGDAENDDDIESLLWMRPVSIDVLCGIFQDTLFRSGGQLGANLIVGGVWNNKAYLRAIHPHGSTDVDLPFTALGSGGLAAMAVLEEGYRSSLTLEEGIELVQRAILSGIRNDLGSGSQVDLCVIDPDGVCIQTRAVIPEEELLPDGTKMNSGMGSSTAKDPSNRTNRLLELLGQGDQNEDVDRNEKSQDNDSKSTNFGVNGFGNQPFAIENTKQRMVSVEMHQAERKEIWDRVLGL
jgi:20S proteasome subunit beta 2